MEELDDEVLVRFDDETFGFGPSTDGYRMTNDWNDSHFSLSIYENSVLYELSSDGEGENLGTGDISPEEFIADLYSAVRGIKGAELIPFGSISVDHVYTLNIEGAKSYLSGRGVIDDEDGLTIDPEAWEETEDEMLSLRPETIRFLDMAFDPIALDDIRDSGKVVFFNVDPTFNYFELVLLMPGDYVEVVPVLDLMDAVTNLSGSPLMYYLNRFLARD